ncbi:MAG: hypothetical protein EA408_08690 [Marinilabiliales bacterium]|nr:MAG: hypothetical protein EA408_08690 [Marinilabiliales bacterium]
MLILLTGLLFITSGQQQSFEDIISNLDNLTNEQAYYRLFEYQHQNPAFANTYIQLGHLCEKIIEELDPLRQYRLVQHYINNAIVYYGLFPVFLESNEVRRNRELYSNIPVTASDSRLTNEDVLEYVAHRLEHNKFFKEKLTTIFEALESSKNHYNNCVRLFNEINNSYDSYNEALLRTDMFLLSHLDELEQEYANTIKAFDRYKALIDEFPLTDYNQEYRTRPINTFRLDGITNSDFLMDEFNIWDYGAWVKEFRNIYQNDILALRQEIEEIEKKFIYNYSYLTQAPHIDQETALDSFDELFLFRLGRFDNNSLIRELFNYNDKRQSFLQLSRNTINNPNDSSMLLMARKLRYYYRLALQLNETLEELDQFNSAITPERAGRFRDFFDDYYNGVSGLREHYNNQQLFLKSWFNNGLGNLNAYFRNEEMARRSFPPAEGRDGVLIPLSPFPAGLPDENSVYFTEDVAYLHGIPAFAAGYARKSGTNVPFVAKISEEQKIEWIKEVGTTNRNVTILDNTAKKVFAYENGVIILSSAKTGNDSDFIAPGTVSYINTLVHIDNNGNIIYQEKIENNGYPLYLAYDEINQLCHIVMGKKAKDDDTFFSEISVCQADSTGKVSWETKLNVKGNFAGMVRAEDKYVVYLNELLTTGNNGTDWGLMIADVSFDGRLLQTTPVIASSSFYVDRVFAISSNIINLMGYPGEPPHRSGNLQYLILSTEGEMVFSNR